VAHLLNPAFLAAVLARTVSGYRAQRTEPMPWLLGFLVAPLVLHGSTRERLPRAVTTPLAAWLTANPDLRVGFADRMSALLPFVREGLVFALAHKAITLASHGTLDIGTGFHFAKLIPEATDSSENDCLTRATFAGKWLARAGSATTAFTLFGVRP
jgi:hypothetical protein